MVGVRLFTGGLELNGAGLYDPKCSMGFIAVAVQIVQSDREKIYGKFGNGGAFA